MPDVSSSGDFRCGLHGLQHTAQDGQQRGRLEVGVRQPQVDGVGVGHAGRAGAAGEERLDQGQLLDGEDQVRRLAG